MNQFTHEQLRLIALGKINGKYDPVYNPGEVKLIALLKKRQKDTFLPISDRDQETIDKLDQLKEIDLDKPLEFFDEELKEIYLRKKLIEFYPNIKDLVFRTLTPKKAKDKIRVYRVIKVCKSKEFFLEVEYFNVRPEYDSEGDNLNTYLISAIAHRDDELVPPRASQIERIMRIYGLNTNFVRQYKNLDIG